MQIKLATVQMPVTRDIGENLPKALGYIARAGEDGADFVLFPECALSGYHGQSDQAAVEAALDDVAAACARARVCALVGTAFREGQTTYNQVRIYDDAGEYLGAHSKTLPTEGDLKWSAAGGGAQVFHHKGVVFGALICNDFWCTPPAPMPDTHLVQQLARKGAGVIFHAINSGFDQRYLKWHTAHLETYARCHEVYVLTANAAGAKPVNAPSGLLAPTGEWIAQADRVGEQYLAVTADLQRE